MLGKTIKLGCKNLNLMYKMLVYVGILTVIGVATAASALSPLAQALLGDVDVWESVKSAFQRLTEGGGIGFGAVMGQIEAFLAAHSKDLWSLFGLGLLMMFLIKLLGSLALIPQAEVIAGNMEKNYEQNFLGVCISTLVASIEYAFFYSLITVPIDAALGLGAGALAYVLRGAFGVFAIPFGVLVFTFLLSLRVSLFGQWVPEILRGGKRGRVFRSLKRSFVGLKESLRLQLPVTFFLFFVFAVLLMATALLTIGLSVLLIMPVAIQLQSCSQLVVFFERHSLKYYSE